MTSVETFVSVNLHDSLDHVSVPVSRHNRTTEVLAVNRDCASAGKEPERAPSRQAWLSPKQPNFAPFNHKARQAINRTAADYH